MFKRFLRPLPIFIISFLIISLPLFLFPINLFKGEIIEKTPVNALPIPAKLSLSYFIGIGYETSDMSNIKDFYLVAEGYFFAVVLLIGIPGIVAYRISLNKTT
jgi:hypothetical protein